MTSTSWVENPLALTRIFLTGCPPIPDMIYVNGNCYLQAIKIPPNFKKRSRRDFKALQSSSPKHRFFYSVGLFSLCLYKNRADKLYHFSQVHRLCVCASGSFITTTFNDFTLIKLSCLHFGQYRGKFLISVSSLIFMRVLFSHIGQYIQ